MSQVSVLLCLVRRTVGRSSAAGARRTDRTHRALSTAQARGGGGGCLEDDPSFRGFNVNENLALKWSIITVPEIDASRWLSSDVWELDWGEYSIIKLEQISSSLLGKYKIVDNIIGAMLPSIGYCYQLHT